MEMSILILVIAALVLALEIFFRIMLPRNVRRITPGWRRAATFVIYGRLGIVAIALILLFVLPSRLIWVSLALLLFGHVAFMLLAWWPQLGKQPSKFSIQNEHKQNESP